MTRGNKKKKTFTLKNIFKEKFEYITRCSLIAIVFIVGLVSDWKTPCKPDFINDVYNIPSNCPYILKQNSFVSFSGLTIKQFTTSYDVKYFINNCLLSSQEPEEIHVKVYFWEGNTVAQSAYKFAHCYSSGETWIVLQTRQFGDLNSYSSVANCAAQSIPFHFQHESIQVSGYYDDDTSTSKTWDSSKCSLTSRGLTVAKEVVADVKRNWRDNLINRFQNDVLPLSCQVCSGWILMYNAFLLALVVLGIYEPVYNFLKATYEFIEKKRQSSNDINVEISAK